MMGEKCAVSVDFHLSIILLDGMSIGPRRSPSLGQQSFKPAGRRNFQTRDPAIGEKKQKSGTLQLLNLLGSADKFD